jgi:hypothetical protein
MVMGKDFKSQIHNISGIIYRISAIIILGSIKEFKKNEDNLSLLLAATTSTPDFRSTAPIEPEVTPNMIRIISLIDIDVAICNLRIGIYTVTHVNICG